MKGLRLFLLMLLFAGLGYGTWVVWHSNALALRRVEVTGNVHVTKNELAAASGLVPGTNLLALSTGKVASKVESVAWIRDARVERIIPSKVRITVVERSPAARVIVSGAAYIADDEGVVLEEGNDAPVEITGLPIESLVPGDRIRIPQYRQALEIVRGLTPALYSKLVRIKAPTVDGITLERSDGVAVLYGAAELLKEKNFAVQALIDEAVSNGSNLASIDVRVPRRPAVRPR